MFISFWLYSFIVNCQLFPNKVSSWKFDWIPNTSLYKISPLFNNHLNKHMSWWKRFEDVLKTSSASLPSEDIFKTSSRGLDQDEYICLSQMSSEDILKMSSRHFDEGGYILSDTSSVSYPRKYWTGKYVRHCF